MIGRKFGFRGHFMMEKIPHAIGNQILPLKWYFGIGYSNGRKYQPIWVLFLILDLNQNSALGRTLPASPFILPMVISNVDMKTNKSVIVYETIF